MNEILYKFYIDKDTGKIAKDIIKKYVLFDGGYRYRKNGLVCFAYRAEFDRFKSGRLYTFDGSEERARKIILKKLTEKQQFNKSEYERLTKLINIIGGEDGENENCTA